MCLPGGAKVLAKADHSNHVLRQQSTRGLMRAGRHTHAYTCAQSVLTHITESGNACHVVSPCPLYNVRNYLAIR